MKWQLGDEHDGRIVQYDGWLDLTDLEAPGKEGLFVFVSKELEVQYIGCARGNLSEEIRNAVSQGKSRGAAMFSWFATNSEDNANGLKAYWVDKYKPENNQRTAE